MHFIYSLITNSVFWAAIAALFAGGSFWASWRSAKANEKSTANSQASADHAKEAVREAKNSNSLLEKANQISEQARLHAKDSASFAREALFIEDEKQRMFIYKNIKYLFETLSTEPAHNRWTFRFSIKDFSAIKLSLIIFNKYFTPVIDLRNKEDDTIRTMSYLEQFLGKKIIDKKLDTITFDIGPIADLFEGQRNDAITCVFHLINQMEKDLKIVKSIEK